MFEVSTFSLHLETFNRSRCLLGGFSNSHSPITRWVIFNVTTVIFIINNSSYNSNVKKQSIFQIQWNGRVFYIHVNTIEQYLRINLYINMNLPSQIFPHSFVKLFKVVCLVLQGTCEYVTIYCPILKDHNCYR